MTKDDTKLAGSATIEMAIIFPMIIGIVILFSYLWLYLYNSYITQLTVRMNLIHYEDNYLIDENLRKEICEKIYRSLEAELLATENIKVEIYADIYKIKVNVDWSMNCNCIRFIEGYVDNGCWKKSYEAKIMRRDPVLFIRNCRMIESLLK